MLGYSEVAELAQPLALADSLDPPPGLETDLIINPHAAGPIIHLRVTTPTDQRAGGQQRWAIWAGPNKRMIRILKLTPGAYFDSASKRWIFLKPADQYGPTLQRLLDLDLRIDLEDPLTNAS